MKSSFNKKLLALAITGALSSASAYAVTFDFNSSDNTATPYAKEIDVAGQTGGFVGEDATTQVGFNLKTNTDYAILFRLDGTATFNTSSAPSMLIDRSANTTAIPGANTTSFTVSNANFVLDNQGVMFEVSQDATKAAQESETALHATSDNFTLTNVKVNLSSPDAVKLTYSLYDDVSSASQGSDLDLIGKRLSGTYMNFDNPVIGVSSGTAPKPKIDVTKGNTVFESQTNVVSGTENDTAALCNFAIAYDSEPRMVSGTAAVSTVTGSTTAVLDAATDSNGTKLIVTGDFSATQDSTGAYVTGSSSPVFLSDTACGTGDGADELAADQAVFYLGNADPARTNVCMTVNGVNEIVSSKYAAQYAPEAASGFNASAVDITCGEVSKGGSSAEIPLLLNAASPFKTYIRVTNPSNVTGVVRINAYNDKGEKGSVMSFELAAGYSTGMIKAADVIAATGVAVLDEQSSANNLPGNKMNRIRLVVDAEFDGVVVRTYALSSDSVGFSQFQ